MIYIPKMLRIIPIKLDEEANIFLALLISADVVFIVVHLIHSYTGILPGDEFSLGSDSGYAENFLYVKEFWIFLMLVFKWVRNSTLVYLSWSLLFGFLLIDDSLSLHERIGNTIASQLGIQPMFGLKPQDYGELGFFIFYSLVFLLIIGGAYYFSDTIGKRMSRILFAMLLILSIFGVFFDMIHSIFFENPRVGPFFGLVEDGGEMVVMSVIAWFVFRLSSAQLDYKKEV